MRIYRRWAIQYGPYSFEPKTMITFILLMVVVVEVVVVVVLIVLS
jgi:hypothetical protein